MSFRNIEGEMSWRFGRICDTECGTGRVDRFQDRNAFRRFFWIEERQFSARADSTIQRRRFPKSEDTRSIRERRSRGAGLERELHTARVSKTHENLPGAFKLHLQCAFQTYHTGIEHGKGQMAARF